MLGQNHPVKHRYQCNVNWGQRHRERHRERHRDRERERQRDTERERDREIQRHREREGTHQQKFPQLWEAALIIVQLHFSWISLLHVNTLSSGAAATTRDLCKVQPQDSGASAGGRDRERLSVSARPQLTCPRRAVPELHTCCVQEQRGVPREHK
ncbi:unnamed protein product [Pleuronectes platessa]|uniref:Uncharacterized protein n=1 Tax=Pleuronectes platessa TaxID=8262 RepID=A0A9N7VI99_PLEPL|nr:unnamed protein product [Pleuronectes platessa]